MKVINKVINDVKGSLINNYAFLLLNGVRKVLKTPFFSKRCVVVSENPLATSIGVEVLRSGGNAVDAAVAISFALSVTVPHLGGIGGDFFALVRLPEGHVRFFNGSGYSSINATPSRLREMGYKEMPERGPLSAVVPGQVDGVHLMWKELGSLEWDELVEPAVHLAMEGFPSNHEFVRAVKENEKLLTRDEGSRLTYLKEELPKAGKVVRFRNLGKALRMIREDHRNFYEGDIATKVSEYIEKKGGLLTYEDFRDFHAYEDTPLELEWGGVEVYEMPPNTQGLTTLHLLKMVKDVDPVRNPPRSAARVSQYLQAYKRAYSLRDAYITDPKFMRLSPTELLNDEFIFNNSSHRDLRSRNFTYGDTTFFAVIDDEGMAVAGVQSLFYHFGSGVTEPTYGVTLNARASSFTLSEGDINVLEPRKKPMHTLSAMIVDHGNGTFRVIGLSGGHYRPQLHLLLFTDMYHYGMEPQEALEFPRFIWNPKTGEVVVEEGINPPGNLPRMKRVPWPSRLGVAAIAELTEDGIKASYADVRGDGYPSGLHFL